VKREKNCKQYETQPKGFVTALSRNCRMKRMTKGNHQELIFTLPWCLTKLPLALNFTKQTNISLEKVKLSIFPLNKIKTPYVHRPFSFPALLSRMKKTIFFLNHHLLKSSNQSYLSNFHKKNNKTNIDKEHKIYCKMLSTIPPLVPLPPKPLPFITPQSTQVHYTSIFNLLQDHKSIGAHRRDPKLQDPLGVKSSL